MVGESAFRPYYKPAAPQIANGAETASTDVCEKLYSSPEPISSSNATSTTERVRIRRRRTTFTPEQTTALEKEYVTDRYMDSSKRGILAESLGLNEMQVKTWFQNRRAKMKKESKKEDKIASPNLSKSDGSLSATPHSTPPITQEVPLVPIPEAPSETIKKSNASVTSPALKAALERMPSCEDSPNENVNHIQTELPMQSPNSDEHYAGICCQPPPHHPIQPAAVPIPTSYADYLSLGLNPAMSIPAPVPYGSFYDVYGMQTADYSGFLNQQANTNPIFAALSSLDPQIIAQQPLANL